MNRPFGWELPRLETSSQALDLQLTESASEERDLNRIREMEEFAIDREAHSFELWSLLLLVAWLWCGLLFWYDECGPEVGMILGVMLMVVSVGFISVLISRCFLSGQAQQETH